MASSFGSYGLADTAQQVLEQDAIFISRGSTPLLRDDEFTRAWKVDAHLAERVRSFLDLYGDGDHYLVQTLPPDTSTGGDGDEGGGGGAGNGGSTPPVVIKEVHAIQDPAAAQGVSMPGWWRVVRNFETPEFPGMVLQTLRRGFLRPPSVSQVTWTTTAGADSEARIWRVQEAHTDVTAAFAKHYVVIYPHVDKTYVREFCEELISRGSISNPTFDQQTGLIGNYRFRVARNEEQEDGTSTVFAVLVDEDANPDGMEVLVYDGCATKEWVTFFFQLATLPEVPESSSGISYRLQNINYDRELGLWSCTLTRIERKTIGVPLHTSNADLFEEREQVTWQGVRDGDLDHKGGEIPLEEVGLAEDGAVVDISRSKNEDCTQNIGQTRSKELPVKDAETRESRTIFQHDISTTDRAQRADAVQSVPEAENGVVVQQTVSKTRSDKRNITLGVSTELPVSNAVKGETKTIYETRERKVDRHQSTPEHEASAAADGVVETKTAEITPGGLYNNTTETTTEKPVLDAQKSKTVSFFETRERTVNSHQQTADGVVSLPNDGKITTKTNDKTPGGLYNVTIDSTQEHQVPGAQKMRSKTIFESHRRDVDRGVGNANPNVVASDVPDASNGLVTSLTLDKTPGGLNIVTIDQRQEIEVEKARRSVRKRAYSTFENVVDRSVAAAPEEDPTDAGTTVTVDKTPGGLFNISTDKPTELVPTITRYTIPDGDDKDVSVVEFYYLDETAFQTLIAGLDTNRRWSLSHSFDESIGTWTGRAIGKTVILFDRGFIYGDVYVTNIEETQFSIRHEAGGRVALIRTTTIYNKRTSNGITSLTNKYKAEPARLDGSQLHWEPRVNRGHYIAVTSRAIKRYDITDDYYLGVEIDFANY